MDSEAVYHYVVANPTHLQAEAIAAGRIISRSVEPHNENWEIMLGVARGWLEMECVGDSSVWIQYGKDRLIVAQFDNSDDAFAFKMRFG